MVSTGSHTTSSRFVSPFIILTVVGLIIGGVLGSIFSLMFQSAPQATQDGIWLLGLGMGQTATAIFGARLARAAMWRVLLIGQLVAIAGLLLTFLSLL
ncbi:MAG: hypothetical protein ACPG8W_02890 [Candidatus Promineifilaceae bacterium]